MKLFKAAQLINPTKVVDLLPNATIVEDLKVFPFLQEDISNLKRTTNVAAADGIMNVNLQDWWKKNCNIGPEVTEECCCASLLLQQWR